MSKTYRRVYRLEAGDVGTTVAFKPVTAKFFRVTFLATAPHPPPPLEEDADGWMGVHVPRTDTQHFERITEACAVVMRRESTTWKTRQPLARADDLYRFATPHARPEEVIDQTSVRDLTARMQPDGTLHWTPPAGNWVIVRMGYSLLGITNHPATAEATGLDSR